jgi:O-antigen ligase
MPLARALLGLGLGWLMVGMAIMPANASLGPCHAFMTSLIVLLFLPAYYVAFAQQARVWRQLWPLPAFGVFLALLAWAALSLCWATLAKPFDGLAALLSVLAFVLGWHAFAANDAGRIRALLLIAGLGLSLCALCFTIRYVVAPTPDGRIIGFGTIATANYAAMLMGAAALWLSQLDIPDRGGSVLRWVAVGFPLVFIALTQSRGTWLALGACVLLMPLWRPERTVRWLALGILTLAIVALVATAAGWTVLLERGTSLRPGLFAQAGQLVAAHPVRGLGLGEAFTLWVEGQPYVHTHNVLTQVAVELGLPGLLLAVAVWLPVAWQGWRHRGSPQGRIVLALWTYATIALQLDMPQVLGSVRPTWLLVWLPFAMALGLAANGSRADKRAR